MCVIIVKPAGVKMPDIEIIKAAYRANPHGCGIVSPSAFYKGLSFNAFLKTLKKASENEPCVIHFRLATHGSIKRANCHPFNRGNVWFAHNGILGIRPEGDLTDSETAFKNIIYPAVERYGYGSAEMETAVNQIIGYSKFAFLCGEDVKLFGGFIHSDDGCYYSNMRFMPYIGFYQRNCRKKAVGWGL